MKAAFRYILTASTVVLSTAMIWGDMAMAEDTSAAHLPKSDAAKSLENILHKAGEQGFLAIEGQNKKPRTPSKTKPLSAVLDPAHFEKLEPINCNIATVLDLSIYQSVSAFDDISLAKSNIKKAERLEDVMSLAKTYLALGFGAETASLVRKFKGHDARLLESMGRLIDGYPSSMDQKTIAEYANCNIGTKFWTLFAKTADAVASIDPEPFELTRDEHIFLEALPPQLQNLVTLRLGIYAAEQSSDILAERILLSLEPQSKYGKLPASKDDDMLYYFALVREMKGDPAARQIFQYLAQYDGLYRTRALQKLAQDNFHNGTTLYESFSDDLEAVSQQYNGQAQSRQATLETIKHRLQAGRLIDAIELSKKEFTLIDIERSQAVALLGDRLHSDLQDEDQSARLYALNSYVHDPLFFSKYVQIEALKNQAYKSAIDLNLPELTSLIMPESHTLTYGQKKRTTYAKVRSAIKHGEYDSAINMSKSHKSDPEFQALILDAAIKSGNRKQALELLRRQPADITRFIQQADMAWQKGHWGEARIALEALAHKKPTKAISDKIAITNYVGIESRAYIDRAIPDTAVELDLLKTQIDSDISLVKAYLTNG